MNYDNHNKVLEYKTLNPKSNLTNQQQQKLFKGKKNSYKISSINNLEQSIDKKIKLKKINDKIDKLNYFTNLDCGTKNNIDNFTSNYETNNEKSRMEKLFEKYNFKEEVGGSQINSGLYNEEKIASNIKSPELETTTPTLLKIEINYKNFSTNTLTEELTFD